MTGHHVQQTHECYSSGEAYDDCQCDETFLDGDIMIIDNEGIIALVGTWPIAITRAYGQLHQLKRDADVEAVLISNTGDEILKATREGILAAIAIAEEKGYPLDIPFQRFAEAARATA